MNHQRGNEPLFVREPARAAAGELRVEVVDAIGEVSAAAWDASANPRADVEQSDPTVQLTDRDTVFNPFLSHNFLSALEVSKSVGGNSGWHVQHLLVKSPDGTLLAAAVLSQEPLAR
jgi:hypothetical protein